MKNYIIALMSISLLGCMSSCKKFTDLAPISTVSDAAFWKNPSQVDAFVGGLHTKFRSQNGSMMFLGELRSDIFGTEPGTASSFTGEATQGLERMWNQNLDMNNSGVSSFGGFYENINQINLLIQKITAVPGVTDANKQYYLGIAYGMRAYYYFQLYKYWGDAIVVTEPGITIDISKLAKAAVPAAEVLKQAKADIDASEKAFGTNYAFKPDAGYWSKAATLMLKAETYLWTAHRTGGVADASIAKNALMDIQSKVASLTLASSFSDVFNVKTNPEIIFTSKNVLNESSMSFITSFTPQTGLIANYFKADHKQFDATLDNWSGLLRAPLKTATFNQFDVKDSRRALTIGDAYSKAADGTFILAGCFLVKFQGIQNAGARAFVNDYPIYRYADLLLMLAEAKVLLGESPAAELNLVRKRAFGLNYDEATLGYPHQAIDANPNNAILKERLFEFIGEGKRWSDLRRFGDAYVYANTSLKANEAYKLLWPIDVNSLTNNRLLKQTTGYPQF